MNGTTWETLVPSLLSVVCLTVGMWSCGTENADDVFTVGIITPGNRIDDNTFNQAAWEGGRQAVRELDVRVEVGERGMGDTETYDYGRQIDEFVADGASLIITVGYNFIELTMTKAAQYPDVFFGVIDVDLGTTANVSSIVFRDDQVSYLAGILAGAMTQSNKVACVGGQPVPPVKRLCNGFAAGVAAQCGDCTTTVHWTQTFINKILDENNNVIEENVGQTAAADLYGNGHDVIFGAAGFTGSMAITHASSLGAWVIGVDLDEYVTTFQTGAVPHANRLLTSAMKRVDRAVFLTIERAVNGTLTPTSLVYSLAVEGVALAPFHEAAGSISDEAQAAVEAAKNALVAGELQTGVDYATGDPN